MGLFDNVYVNQPGFDPEEAFQTKDFDPYMHRYDITNDGRLVFTEWKFGEGEPPTPKDTEFHGILHAGNIRANDDWVDIEAKFTDGNLVSIKTTIETKHDREARRR